MFVLLFIDISVKLLIPTPVVGQKTTFTVCGQRYLSYHWFKEMCLKENVHYFRK